MKFVNNQWAWSYSNGWARVSNIRPASTYCVEHKDDLYTDDGYLCSTHKFPTLLDHDPLGGTEPPEFVIDWVNVPRDTKVACHGCVHHFSNYTANAKVPGLYVYINHQSSLEEGLTTTLPIADTVLVHQEDIDKYKLE